MVEPFKKSNKFSLYCSIADAAVEWQGLLSLTAVLEPPMIGVMEPV